VYENWDGAKRFWSSRHHRKQLVLEEDGRPIIRHRVLLRSLWMPSLMNWWIGVIFAIGAASFAVASLLYLLPSVAKALSLSTDIYNQIYFAGSLPFTTAAYLQLFQAANVVKFGEAPSHQQKIKLIGWNPSNVGWLSCLLQFFGTILFNVNTLDAQLSRLTWFQQDLLIWAPNIVGSVLFLISGYLAFIETCHAHFAWLPRNSSWWVVLVNLLGCIAFLIAAFLAIVLPGPSNPNLAPLAVVFTLLGAIGFFVGSLLMLPEAAFGSETSSRNKAAIDAEVKT